MHITITVWLSKTSISSFPSTVSPNLKKEGIIGNLVDTHYSCSYVNNVVPLVTETVPQMISRIKADGVDVVLLVPV